MSTARRHRFRPAAAVLAAFTVFAFVGTNVAAFLHAAAERHETCAEHGELIHPATAAIDRDQAPADAAQLLAGAPGVAGADHDHCGLCPSSRPPVEALSAPAIIAAPAIACRQVELPPLRASGQANLYRLAPKTSPPV